MFDREPAEKVRLYWNKFKEKEWEFDEPPHEPIPGLTIQPSQIRGRYSLFGLPPDEPGYWCLIDNGAMLTLIPKDIWQPYQDQIRWLHTKDGALTQTKISGASVHFRLGLVAMHFVDFDRRVLSRQIITGCVTRGNAPKTTILGLGFGDALTAGGLCLNFVDDSLWLVSV